MGCRLVGTKPISEPMLGYCLFDPWNKFQWNYNQNRHISIQDNAFENVVCKMAATLSRPQCVKNAKILSIYNRSVGYVTRGWVRHRSLGETARWLQLQPSCGFVIVVPAHPRRPGRSAWGQGFVDFTHGCPTSEWAAVAWWDGSGAGLVGPGRAVVRFAIYDQCVTVTYYVCNVELLHPLRHEQHDHLCAR